MYTDWKMRALRGERDDKLRKGETIYGITFIASPVFLDIKFQQFPHIVNNIVPVEPNIATKPNTISPVCLFCVHWLDNVYRLWYQ